jgi:hypothetical protein
LPRRYAVDSSQQSTSMSSYSVHRSIPPTQGTVPTSYYYPDILALNRKAGVPKRRPRSFLIHPIAEKGNSRKLRERHKDKEQDAYTFYSTEALITKIARQALAGPFRPRQAIISRLRRTTNAMRKTIAGKA